MSIQSHKLAVAVMVVNENGKLLLVKNLIRGWEFPGGYVGEGESLKAAAIREVQEESGVQIQLVKFFGIDQDVARSTCIIIFEGKPISGKLSKSDEHQEVGYFTFDEAMSRIKQKIYKDRISRCLNENEHPFIIEI